MTRCPISAVAVCLAALSAAAATAQEEAPSGNSPQWLKSIEMLGHTALAERRNRPGVELNAFTTDGCSGGMSTIWAIAGRAIPALADIHSERPPWEHCCVTHDRAYHSAGPDPEPEASYANRLAADLALKSCVEDTAASRTEPLAGEYGLSQDEVSLAYSLIAEGMFSAVRIGGQPCSGLPWRWGYGWPDCQAFFSLDPGTGDAVPRLKEISGD